MLPRILTESSRFLMFVERLWQAFLPLFLLLAGVLVTAGLGLWSPLPLLVHVPLLGLCVIGAGVLFVRGLRRCPVYPTALDARRGLEKQKNLLHRPLSFLSDRPSVPLTPAQHVLWQKARKQAMRTRVLLPRWPESAFHKTDMWGVRYPLALGLLLLCATNGAPTLIGEALFPIAKTSGLSRVLGVEVWLEPPAYTGRPGFALEQGTTAQVLTGTTLRAQVHVRKPLLVTPKLTTESTFPLPAVSGGYTASTTLTVSGPVTLSYGWTTLFGAHVDVTPDSPPMIQFSKDLARTSEGLLEVNFSATDDYGLKAAWLVAEHPAVGQISQSLVLPTRNNTQVDDHAYVDFTAEMIAGQEARVYLKVMDVAGQMGESDAFNVLLPEREFHHPVAKKLVQLRKDLVADPLSGASAMTALDAIMAAPDTFNNDTRAYLSMTLARQILFYRGEDKDHFIPRATGLMWDAAIRIEKGPVSQMLEEVMQRQQELQKALAEGASPEKLKALFAQFQQAMADLFQSMTFNGPDKMQNLQDIPGLRDEDVARLMQKISDLMASGAYDEARKALKQLEDLMANIQFGNDPQTMQVVQMLQKMGDLSRQQKELIEQSFKNPVPGRLTLEQQVLQKQLLQQTQKLSQELQQMGLPAGQLNRAMEAMRQVMQNAGKPGSESYVNHLMNQAFQSLEQAKENMVQQLMQQAGYGNMMGMKRDPSGQLHHDGEKVTVPEESPETLSRKIRDELYNRADDLGRPDKEQQYLKRLLDRF
ncbi:MAG: DUF4175 family protein [Proteobacteria bacterium]|nr:DUF4175 family protein [Pseudomonadota bacterium]